MDETNRQGVIVLISLGFAPPPAPPPKPCGLFRGPKDAASRRHGVSPAPRRTPFPVPWPAWPVWPGPPAEATWRPRTGHRAVETYGKGAGTEGAGALCVAPPLPSAPRLSLLPRPPGAAPRNAVRKAPRPAAARGAGAGYRPRRAAIAFASPTAPGPQERDGRGCAGRSGPRRPADVAPDSGAGRHHLGDAPEAALTRHPRARRGCLVWGSPGTCLLRPAPGGEGSWGAGARQTQHSRIRALDVSDGV